MRGRRRQRASLALAIVLILVGLRQWWQERGSGPDGSPAVTVADSSSIERLFAERASGVLTRARGRVQRLLPDDNEGSRHQRFIVELSSKHTVLVSHNIDLAARVPLAAGDDVEFQGDFEWNERGGVVHWTHRDPRGEREGGWIRHRGVDYR